jgi:uncharacterized protein
MIVVYTARITFDETEISGSEKPESLSFEDDLIDFDRPVEYRLIASLVNNGLLVKGSAKTVARCRCGRCLEEFDLPIECDEVCHFFENPLPTELDLTDAVREDILILLPRSVVCRPECAGLCSSCGQNRNEGDCLCAAPDGMGGAWDVLDKLRLADDSGKPRKRNRKKT